MAEFLPFEPENDTSERGRGVSFGTQYRPKYNVDQIKFGDHYSGRSHDGLRKVLKTYSVKWKNLTFEEFETLSEFLDDLAGVSFFLWHPRGKRDLTTDPYKFISSAPSWTEDTFNHWSGSATFTQVYDND